MAEDANVGPLGLILLGLAFVGTAFGVAYFGQLSSEKIFEETFAAAAQTALGVVVVGVVVRWYQQKTKVREERMTTLRELSLIRQTIRDAAFLMNAHKSALTWTQQMRELVILIPRLTDLQEARMPGGTRNGLDRAKVALDDLKDEYMQRHDDVARLGTQWDAILALVPKSKEHVVGDRSPLLAALDESIGRLKQLSR